MFWWRIALLVVLNLITYALMPKPQNRKPESIDASKIPSVEEGKEIPVVFGTVELSPFVAWFGDLKTQPIYAQGGKK